MSRYEFVQAESASFPIAVMCSALSVSTSGYYSWRNRAPSEREKKRAERTEKVSRVFVESRRTYGSPRVTCELRAQGEVVAEKTVAQIMAKNELVARGKRRFKATTDSRKTKRIASNLLKRNFKAERPDQVWVTDVTALWTMAGWVYLSVLVDLYARRVISWATSHHNDTALALGALTEAVRKRTPPRGLIHHSDRGSPYASDDYLRFLKQHGIDRSMSRKGDCWDNAVAESFFSTLEFECIRGSTFIDRSDAEAHLRDFIDDFYNPRRRHSTIGLVSPLHKEIAFALRAQAA